MGSIVMELADIASYASIYYPGVNLSTICMSLGNIQSRGFFNGFSPLNYSYPLLLAQLTLASLVILFSSRLLKPLGQPAVVPQILGGIILGPSVVGHAVGFAESMFPLRGFVIIDSVSLFGYIFYFFLIGVQIDPWVLKKIEKNQLIIGISTVALALVLSITWSFVALAKFSSIDQEIASSLPIVATTNSVLSFPMMAQYLSELKMANSEFGQLALSCSAVSNLFSFCVITLTILSNQQSGEKLGMLKTLSSGVAMALVIFVVVRPAILWKLKRKGDLLTEEFTYVILVGVLVSAFASQASGLNIIYGPLIYGLAIPPGPPLASALVEKLELINSSLFMPLYFVKNGLAINIFAVDFKNYLVVQFIISMAWTGKFLGALISSLYCNIPAKDAVLLGLVMNVQGILELGMYKMMKQAKAIGQDAFMVMCTSMLFLIAAMTPIIRYLYDPLRKYAVYNKRTVMHLTDNSELRVLTCIHDQENVSTTISLLEAINPSKRSPIAIYALHLIELVGCAHPLLIPHKLSKGPSSKASSSRSIVNAFRQFEKIYHGAITVHPFTAISPYATMHDEICTMALSKKVSLIIVPFHRRFNTVGAWEAYKKGIMITNDNILDMAPCSVAIIVDRGFLNNSRLTSATWSSYRVAVLFLGGADDREALALAARMAGQPNINLTVVRLLGDGSITIDTTGGRMLDNEVVSEFRLNMAGNNRIKYIEEVAMDSKGLVAAMQSMKNNYELIMVGRRHDKRLPLILGLAGWKEERQLGALGGILASADFHGNTSILVVQQHAILENEWHENAQDFSLDVSRGRRRIRTPSNPKGSVLGSSRGAKCETSVS